jgi:hypothetical protein
MGGGSGGTGIDALVKDIFKAVLPVRELTQELGIPFMDSKMDSQMKSKETVVSPKSSDKLEELKKNSEAV